MNLHQILKNIGSAIAIYLLAFGPSAMIGPLLYGNFGMMSPITELGIDIWKIHFVLYQPIFRLSDLIGCGEPVIKYLQFWGWGVPA